MTAARGHSRGGDGDGGESGHRGGGRENPSKGLPLGMPPGSSGVHHPDGSRKQPQQDHHHHDRQTKSEVVIHRQTTVVGDRVLVQDRPSVVIVGGYHNPYWSRPLHARAAWARPYWDQPWCATASTRPQLGCGAPHHALNTACARACPVQSRHHLPAVLCSQARPQLPVEAISPAAMVGRAAAS